MEQDQQENQRAIQYGKNFAFLTAMEGWGQLEKLLDQFEKDTLDDLTDYMGSDDSILRAKQIAHMAVKKTNKAIRAHVQEAIMNSEELVKGEYLNE